MIAWLALAVALVALVVSVIAIFNTEALFDMHLSDNAAMQKKIVDLERRVRGD